MSGVGVLTAAVVAVSAPLQVPRHRPIPVPELATTSALAGVAVVDRVSTLRDPENQFIYTDAHLRFEELWKGQAAPEIRLRQYGGRLEDRAAGIPGWGYALKPGERVVVFVVPFRDGTFTLKGSRQGLYRISDSRPPTAVRDLYVGHPGRERTLTLEELKRDVYAALGRGVDAPSHATGAGNAVAPGEKPAEDRAEAPSGEPAQAAGAAEPRGRDRTVRWTMLALVLAGLAAVALTMRMSRAKDTEGRA